MNNEPSEEEADRKQQERRGQEAGGTPNSFQGKAVEAIPGLPTFACGQKDIPGIAQSLKLEHATILTDADIVAAVGQVLSAKTGGAPGGWSYVPPRYFVS